MRTSLTEELEPESLILGAYPNPVTSKLTISLRNELSKTDNIRIYDMMGRGMEVRQMTRTGNAVTMDMGHLIPGLYLVQVRSTKGYEIIKVVKE